MGLMSYRLHALSFLSLATKIKRSTNGKRTIPIENGTLKGRNCIKITVLRQLRRPDLNHKSLKTYIWVFKLFLSHCLQFQFFCGIISITSKSRCERVMTMERIFNITGSCNPQQHYMVNLDSRLAEIKKWSTVGIILQSIEEDSMGRRRYFVR